MDSFVTSQTTRITEIFFRRDKNQSWMHPTMPVSNKNNNRYGDTHIQPYTKSKWKGRETLRALEFYSGIGGFHAGLERTGVRFKVLGSFDMNEQANTVHKATFLNTPVSIRNIGFLTACDLETYGAHLWMLSPPCQPYTRKGSRRGAADPRADSLGCLLAALVTMREHLRPRFLVLENVLGFENSASFSVLTKTLGQCGFTWQAFELNPLGLGVPYSRPRLFVVAKRGGGGELDGGPISKATFPCSHLNQTVCARPPKEYFPRIVPGFHADDPPATLSEVLGNDMNAADINDALLVPERVLWDAGRFLDIVGADDRRTTCFTKSYGSYMRGSGSVVRTDISAGWREREAAALASLQALRSELGPTHLAPSQPLQSAPSTSALETVATCEDDSTEEIQNRVHECHDGSPIDLGDCQDTFVKDCDSRTPLQHKKRQQRRGKKQQAIRQPKWWETLNQPCPLSSLRLRYFSPEEIARLHGFSESLVFPSSLSLVQRFKLLGNSLHVDVVCMLLNYIFDGHSDEFAGSESQHEDNAMGVTTNTMFD